MTLDITENSTYDQKYSRYRSNPIKFYHFVTAIHFPDTDSKILVTNPPFLLDLKFIITTPLSPFMKGM